MARRKPFDLELAIDMYQNQNFPTSSIAKIFKVNLQTVINRFKESGIPLRPQGQAPSLIDTEKIKYDYEINKMSVSQIASKYSISISLARKKLAQCGIKVKRSGGSHRAIMINQQELRDMYCNQLMTMESCARHFGVSSTVIRRHLGELDIDIRPSTQQSLIN